MRAKRNYPEAEQMSASVSERLKADRPLPIARGCERRRSHRPELVRARRPVHDRVGWLPVGLLFTLEAD